MNKLFLFFVFKALQLLQQKESKFLSTFIPTLDQILHGGLHIGTITEVYV